jgi:hypothetical protein
LISAVGQTSPYAESWPIVRRYLSFTSLHQNSQAIIASSLHVPTHIEEGIREGIREGISRVVPGKASLAEIETLFESRTVIFRVRSISFIRAARLMAFFEVD